MNQVWYHLMFVLYTYMEGSVSLLPEAEILELNVSFFCRVQKL